MSGERTSAAMRSPGQAFAAELLVRFRVGELEFTASVSDVAERALTIQFRAPKVEMHEQLLEAAGRRGGVFSLEDDKEWRVADVSFAYVGSEPWGMHHHTWRIEQVERVTVGTLRLGTLELQPYDYREETDVDGILRLALRAAVIDEDLQALAKLSGTVVEVLRDDEPRPMLLEGFVWGAGAHGQAVALVCTDLLEPRVTLSGASALEPSLLALLERKDVLSSAELIEMRRVANVDAWEL